MLTSFVNINFIFRLVFCSVNSLCVLFCFRKLAKDIQWKGFAPRLILTLSPCFSRTTKMRCFSIITIQDYITSVVSCVRIKLKSELVFFQVIVRINVGLLQMRISEPAPIQSSRILVTWCMEEYPLILKMGSRLESCMCPIYRQK